MKSITIVTLFLLSTFAEAQTINATLNCSLRAMHIANGVPTTLDQRNFILSNSKRDAVFTLVGDQVSVSISPAVIPESPTLVLRLRTQEGFGAQDRLLFGSQGVQLRYSVGKQGAWTHTAVLNCESRK